MPARFSLSHTVGFLMLCLPWYQLFLPPLTIAMACLNHIVLSCVYERGPCLQRHIYILESRVTKMYSVSFLEIPLTRQSRSSASDPSSFFSDPHQGPFRVAIFPLNNPARFNASPARETRQNGRYRCFNDEKCPRVARGK